MFENILNWKLLSGSHKFPGPDGGTCINEAAIVAAGFKYRAVQNSADCPPCFSRVIASYAIVLNEAMPHDFRQELLMPFVTRLAGTADTDAKEIERARYIAIQTIKRILPIALRAIDFNDHAQRCEQVGDINAAADVAYASARAADASAAACAAFPTLPAFVAAAECRTAVRVAATVAARFATYAGVSADAAKARHYANAGARAATYAADALRAAEGARGIFQIFQTTAAILDETIRLGNQAEPIETALVVCRMQAIKRQALEKV
jgi:hypothetical protein